MARDTQTTKAASGRSKIISMRSRGGKLAGWLPYDAARTNDGVLLLLSRDVPNHTTSETQQLPLVLQQWRDLSSAVRGSSANGSCV